MQLLEWLALMKEVVMCNKNLMLKSPFKVNSFASKTWNFRPKVEGRSDRRPVLPKRNVTF